MTKSNVVRFPAERRRPNVEISSIRPPTESLTETAKNAALRKERAERWDRAETATRYWHAKLDYDYICMAASRHGLIPPCPVENRTQNIENWRSAQVAQLLTPAPTAAAIAWKRQAFASGQYLYTDVKAEQIERAIELDAAWLAAHPMRRKRAAAIEAAGR
jgi:hypothetical protein